MREVPIPTVHLFRRLDSLLIRLIESLSPADWERKTLAPAWTVKDVASHLLDGNVRMISGTRDHYPGEVAGVIDSYQDLVRYLNRINADWVQATRRMSPQLLTELLKITGKEYSSCIEKKDPFAPAPFSVAWAGESTSLNWFHIAREYAEKWHHQQQIREAVGVPGIMTKEYYFPAITTFMQALPHAYRNERAAEGTVIKITVSGEAGGTWILQRVAEKWSIVPVSTFPQTAEIVLDPDTAWQLFTKALPSAAAKQRSTISGNEALAQPLFNMISVMA